MRDAFSTALKLLLAVFLLAVGVAALDLRVIQPFRTPPCNPETLEELLANAMEALMTAEDKGFCIVIFCSRDCTSSAAVANELKKPEYGIRAPIFILEGGWDELRKEPSLVP